MPVSAPWSLRKNSAESATSFRCFTPVSDLACLYFAFWEFQAKPTHSLLSVSFLLPFAFSNSFSFPFLFSFATIQLQSKRTAAKRTWYNAPNPPRTELFLRRKETEPKRCPYQFLWTQTNLNQPEAYTFSLPCSCGNVASCEDVTIADGFPICTVATHLLIYQQEPILEKWKVMESDGNAKVLD